MFVSFFALVASASGPPFGPRNNTSSSITSFRLRGRVAPSQLCSVGGRTSSQLSCCLTAQTKLFLIVWKEQLHLAQGYAMECYVVSSFFFFQCSFLHSINKTSETKLQRLPWIFLPVLSCVETSCCVVACLGRTPLVACFVKCCGTFWWAWSHKTRLTFTNPTKSFVRALSVGIEEKLQVSMKACRFRFYQILQCFCFFLTHRAATDTRRGIFWEPSIASRLVCSWTTGSAFKSLRRVSKQLPTPDPTSEVAPPRTHWQPRTTSTASPAPTNPPSLHQTTLTLLLQPVCYSIDNEVDLVTLIASLCQ